MRILWISATFPHPPIDGGAVRAFNLIKGLAARGHALSVVAYGPDRVAEADRAAVGAAASWVRAVPRPGPLPLRRRVALKLGRLPSAVRWYDTPAMWEAVDEARRACDPDVVVGDLHHVARYAQALARPCVLNLNDSMALTLDREAATEPSWLRAAACRFEARRFRRFERALSAGTLRVVVVSRADAEYFARLGCRRVEVVANGVDTAYYDAGAVAPETSGGASAIFTGNLSHPPNVKAVSWFVRQVLPRVREEAGPLEVRLVGLAPSPEIQALARGDAAIRVIGFVPDLRPWLAGSQVYVAPMQSGSGIKNKVLEAMAMGLPVVATPLAVEGMPQVRPGVHAAVAADAGAFAREVAALLRDPARARRLGDEGRRLVRETYGWAARTAEFEAVLQAAVADYTGLRST